LLLAAGANPNVMNVKERSPLLIAVLQKEVDFAKLLLDAGADPHFAPLKEKGKGNFPYAIAEKKRLSEFVELFRNKRTN
jgi:ankyrin repeat protein